MLGCPCCLLLVSWLKLVSQTGLLLAPLFCYSLVDCQVLTCAIRKNFILVWQMSLVSYSKIHSFFPSPAKSWRPPGLKGGSRLPEGGQISQCGLMVCKGSFLLRRRHMSKTCPAQAALILICRNWLCITVKKGKGCCLEP